MKKLINNPADVVAEALLGIDAAHPELRVDHEHRVIYRADAPRPGKVGLISGGGSGHEPMHGGFVGLGMLDAACAGEIFTSPVPDQMVAATEAVNAGAGVLHIVKNYTGDVMNFEMAAEMAGDVEVVSVVTDDDVAVTDSLYTTGRRGVGVTVLLEKIAGAAAEEGRSRVPVGTAAEIADMLVAPILDDADFTGGDGVLAFVNGMGGTPLIELYVMYREVASILQKSGITVARSLVGNYITSLEMAGCSVTLLKVDDEMVRLWDAPVRTPGLRWGI